MRRAQLVVIAGLLSVLAAGCWDHIPIEDSAYVMLAGIDNNPQDPAEIILTQQIVLPTEVQAGAVGEGIGNGEGTPFYLVSSNARSLQRAWVNMERRIPRITQANHMRGIIFGDDFARSGVDRAVGWLIRHPQVRPAIFVVVSEGPAQPFLDAQPILAPQPGRAITQLLRDVGPLGLGFEVLLYEFVARLLSPRQDVAVPLVRRTDPLRSRVDPDFEQAPIAGETPENGGGNGPATEDEGTDIELVGLAVFRDDQMVGTLKGPEARGAAWVHGTSLGTITIRHPEEARYGAISFVRARTHIDTRLENGEQLRISITVDALGDVFEIGVTEPLAASRWTREIEAAAASAITQEIALAMDRVIKDYRADIFGVGEMLYRRSPQDWRRVKDRWHEVYAEAEVDINVKVTLDRTGLAR